MTTETVKVEEVVQAYLAIRSARESLKAKFEEEDAELKLEQEELGRILLDVCNKNDASSIRTDYGTIVRRQKDVYSCTNWANFKEFIIKNNLLDVLQQRIHQSNFKSYLEQHPHDGMPPGINVLRELEVVVRKPTN